MGHSLGGASLLIYIVMQRLKNKPHYISRLVLLTPAGFLKTSPIPWVRTSIFHPTQTMNERDPSIELTKSQTPICLNLGLLVVSEGLFAFTIPANLGFGLPVRWGLQPRARVWSPSQWEQIAAQ